MWKEHHFNSTEVIVILSILLAQSFRVSSAVIAVRVRLCKTMELRHGSTRASLACKSTSHRVVEQPSVPISPALSHQTTQEGLASTPAHRSLVCLVSSHLDIRSFSAVTAHTARPHCASLVPAAVELRLHSCYQASSTLATNTTIQCVSPCNNRPASIAIYRSSARLQQ